MTSKDIYTPITPTYLYIKQHSISGLKYFGKTTKDPYTYNGSGKHWKRHIKKHGKEYIVTLWVSDLFHDTSIVDYALQLSEEYNIVESKEWANLEPENGLNGGAPGRTHTGRTYTSERKVKMSVEYTNRTDEQKNTRSKNISEAHANRTPDEKLKTKELSSICLTNTWLSKTDKEKVDHGILISFGMSKISSEEKLISSQKRNETNLAKSSEEKDIINTKRSVSNKLFWSTKTDEEMLAWSEIQSECKIGVSHPITTCPHCDLSGGSRNMKRWHFDNCRFKPLPIE